VPTTWAYFRGSAPPTEGGHLHSLRRRFETNSVATCTDRVQRSVLPSRLQESTRSCGWRPVPGADLDLHLEAVALLPQGSRLFAADPERLRTPGREALASAWLRVVSQGLRSGPTRPAAINLPGAALAPQLLEALGSGELRAGPMACLGQVNHWFPAPMPSARFTAFLKASCFAGAGAIAPWAEQIPEPPAPPAPAAWGSPSQSF